MSDAIKHECGIGLLRLLKPLEYYHEKYGSALWGLNKMFLLMEKQRNRGQDGAGLAAIKLNVKPGRPYLHRIRDNQAGPLANLHRQVEQRLEEIRRLYPDTWSRPDLLKQHFEYAGEVLLGHLRYGTHGSYGIEACHPVVRPNEYMNRSLAVAGNFNLTNVDYLFQKLVELGQHPRYLTDTETILERVGHFLDVANDHLHEKYKAQGHSPQEISAMITEELSPTKVIKNAAKPWDGGYVIGGIVGNGDAFVLRDPNGIRPCYYYCDDEILVAASERAAISTIFNLEPGEINELPPAHVLSVKGCNNIVKLKEFTEPKTKLSCSFERIYFSRGIGAGIYQERKALGEQIAPRVLEAIHYDLDNTIFDYVPNSAESAFLGMIKTIERINDEEKLHQIRALGPEADEESLRAILQRRPRVERMLHKDVKMRTFIADDAKREGLVSQGYDITHGASRPGLDTLVFLDDSIVRGTTLRNSLLRLIERLHPKKILVVSSAPQIRYPDCYGIDMSQIDKLVAFQAAVSLLQERHMEDVLDKVHHKILRMRDEGSMDKRNVVSELYAPFSEEEISQKITEMARPAGFSCELEIIFQPLENLARAIPGHRGDWYFSGNYPTPGGNRIVNQSFLNYMEGRSERAYQMGMA